MGRTLRSGGFTLMELMTALAVAGVILAIAVPNFREFGMNGRMTGAANDFLSAIQLARSEAIKRQQTVSLCASANSTAPAPACNPPATGQVVVSNSASRSGWIVWSDPNENALIDPGEQLVTQHPLLASELTVIADSTMLSYGRNGFRIGAVGGNPTARIALFCDQRGDNPASDDTYKKRVVAVSDTGRPAVLKFQTAIDDVETMRFGGAGNCP